VTNHEPRTANRGLSVAVLGGAGYVGGELLRLLSRHPAVATVRAFSESHAGKPWSAAHPGLVNIAAGAFEAMDVAAAARWADAVLLALPHGRSQHLAADLASARLVVDLAADFRVSDRELYEAHYGAHAAFAAVGTFAYGLADVVGDGLAGARRIAVPGCFATAALLTLWPLACAGLLASRPSCFAITGSSGAGAEPKRSTHHPVRAHSFFAYSLAGHRHEAELADRLRHWTGGAVRSCALLTHSAPLVRGIHATLHARLARPLPDPLALLRGRYAGRPFIRVLGAPPELAAVVGTNFAHLHAAPREDGESVIVTCTIDNLVKGAAGQALQAMNLALGLPETAGLEFPGIWPC
jgi:N-acetyl-gamma-glutamyl-phosphate reductase common form